MGTRALYGFEKNSVKKTTYNHFDGYIDGGLGETIIKFVKAHSVEELNKMFDKIRMVDDSIKPTSDDVRKCAKYSDFSVSEQSIEDWYCLLRGTQGDLYVYETEFDLMYKHTDTSGLDYGYIINLDNNTLEFYYYLIEFYNKDNDEKANPFITSISFDEIHNNTVYDIVKKVESINKKRLGY